MRKEPCIGQEFVMSHQRAEKAESFLRKVSPHASLESLESPQDIVAKLMPQEPLPPEHIDLAESAARKFATGAEMSPPEVFALEAIIIPDKRPAIDIINGDYTVSHKDWLHFNNDVPIKTNIRKAIPSIGRVELPQHPTLPYGGTGFVVGDGLLMTNRHVAEIFSTGLGIRNLVFRPGYGAGVDFLRERNSTASRLLGIRRVVMIHPFWDMALLHVDGLPPEQAPLRLSLHHPEEMIGRDVAVVGYPAFDPRNDAKVQDTVFGGVYYVKRLQPGKLRDRRDIESFGKNVPAATHDASTLGGNSGSAVIDPNSGCVVGLHFAGVYLDANFAVPTFELARDPRVVDAGLNFERRSQPEARIWDEWWKLAGTDESAANPEPGKLRANLGAQRAVSPASDPSVALKVSEDATWTLPIEITVRMPHLAAPARVSASGVLDAEKMVAPTHDPDYSDREGYEPNFLGVAVPPPEPIDTTLVSRIDNGQHLIPYHHFSLAIHKARRLALFTASNLDASKKSKIPEDGRSYSRDSLGGLGKNDTELWFQDPRIPAAHQLPDRFFTKDHGAFDKGHLVRREDVAWGSTFQEVQFANGDTFHTTNCSPQIGKFNRPDQRTNWGQLENYIFKNAGEQKLCVFAGPVLSPDDHTFVGLDDRGPVRSQIPSCFWKIVVSADDGKLQSFGFLLKQDLSNVPLEFAVAPAWKQLMITIAGLEQMLGSIRFPDVVQSSDQARTSRGAMVRNMSGVEMIAATEVPSVSRGSSARLKQDGPTTRDASTLSEGPITFRDHFASLYQSAVVEIARKSTAGPVSGLEAAGATVPGEGAYLILAAEKVVTASRSPPSSRAGTTEPSGRALEKMTALDRAQTCAALGWELMRAKLLGDSATVASVQEELTAGTCDPLWAQTIEEYVRYFGPNGTRKPPIYVEPKDAGGPIGIPSGATVAIIGDWGTGAGPAIDVLDAVRENKPDVIIHLGDIYYSGTPDECRTSFESIFDQVFGSSNRPPVYTLCGNHDMYCGGVGFYGLIDRLNGGEKRQKASFFCLRSDDGRWQLLAMDTGRNDYSPFSVTDVVTFVEPAEEEWHVQRLKEFNGRTILFSHHQLFSAFSQIGAPGAGGALGAYNVKLKRTYDRLLATGRPISAWFWGHEHNLCVYEPYLGLGKGRCVGHGAIPVFVADEPYTTLPGLVSPPRIIPDTTLSTEDQVYTHGFAMLSLRPEAVDARYYELVNGKMHCIYTEQIT
jgi:DNA/RNA endonuclease G (NUC1)